MIAHGRKWPLYESRKTEHIVVLSLSSEDRIAKEALDEKALATNRRVKWKRHF